MRRFLMPAAPLAALLPAAARGEVRYTARDGRALAGGGGAIRRQMNNLSCLGHPRDARCALPHAL